MTKDLTKVTALGRSQMELLYPFQLPLKKNNRMGKNIYLLPKRSWLIQICRFWSQLFELSVLVWTMTVRQAKVVQIQTQASLCMTIKKKVGERYIQYKFNNQNHILNICFLCNKEKCTTFPNIVFPLLSESYFPKPEGSRRNEVVMQRNRISFSSCVATDSYEPAGLVWE